MYVTVEEHGCVVISVSLLEEVRETWEICPHKGLLSTVGGEGGTGAAWITTGQEMNLVWALC